MKKKISLLIVLILCVVTGGVFLARHLHYGFFALQEVSNDTDSDDVSVPAPQPVSISDMQSEPGNTGALGGYNVLIADRGNNRLVEITPDKKIVWEYHFDLPRLGLSADDSFFTDNGKTVIVNLELYHIIEEIAYQSKQVIWSYGNPGVPGSAPGYLNRPDDAYKLPNGDVVVADIENCRVIEISPDKKIVRQYGVTGMCKDATGYLDKPNGDTPLANGHMLISNIGGNNVVELDQSWKPVLTLKLPLAYPSDPQPMQDGNILVSAYTNPGRIIEITRSGKVVWDYHIMSGAGRLNKPSLAVELPNGNIMANDDLNDRIIVIDKNTKQIIWQYGVTGKPGRAYGQLSIPDGTDIIMRGQSPNATISAQRAPYTIGYVIHHTSDFLGKTIQMIGYPLQKEGNYVIFSDEASGALSVNDTPVIGQNVLSAAAGHSYLLTGTLVRGGLDAINKNKFHFELSASLRAQ